MNYYQALAAWTCQMCLLMWDLLSLFWLSEDFLRMLVERKFRPMIGVQKFIHGFIHIDTAPL